MYCEKCGKEIPDGTRLCEECNSEPQNKIMRYVSIALAIMGAVLPFMKWIEVPVAKGLYSMFGMGEQTPTFSLFGYLFAGSNYQTDSVFAVMLVIALIALVGIVFNVGNIEID